jgi:transcriptional regulator with PAS, ATPase and Fis domain
VITNLKNNIVDIFNELKQLIKNIDNIWLVFNNVSVVDPIDKSVIYPSIILKELEIPTPEEYISQNDITNLFNSKSIKDDQYTIQTLDDNNSLFIAPILYIDIPTALLIIKINGNMPNIFFDTLALFVGLISSAVFKILYLSTVIQKSRFIRAIQDIIPDYLWIKDADGKYTYANEKAMEFLDAQDNKDVLNKTYDYFYNTKLLKYKLQNFKPDNVNETDRQVIKNKESVNYVESGYNKDIYETYSVYKAPILSNDNINAEGIIGHAINLTEYITLQKELYKMDTLLKIITDQIPNLLFVHDKTGIIIYSNKQLIESSLVASKLTYMDIIGQHYKDVFANNKEFVDALYRIDKLILEHKKTIEHTIKTDNNDWYSFIHTPLLFNKDIIGIISIGTDITEQIREFEKIKKEVELITKQYFINNDETHADMKREFAKIKEKLSAIKTRNGGA